jgi:cysteine desulfuration protein SufE
MAYFGECDNAVAGALARSKRIPI